MVFCSGLIMKSIYVSRVDMTSRIHCIMKRSRETIHAFGEIANERRSVTNNIVKYFHSVTFLRFPMKNRDPNINLSIVQRRKLPFKVRSYLFAAIKWLLLETIIYTLYQ